MNQSGNFPTIPCIGQEHGDKFTACLLGDFQDESHVKQTSIFINFIISESLLFEKVDI